MLRIEIFLFNNYPPGFPHFVSHIGAVIYDEDNNAHLAIEYGSQNPDSMLYVKKEKYLFCSKTTLKTEGCLSDFKEQYQKKFLSKDYKFLTRNCADAVNFILDFFFKPKKTTNTFRFFKALCAIPSTSTCGCFGFLPAPPGITSPKEVYLKAQLISSLKIQENKTQNEEIENNIRIIAV